MAKVSIIVVTYNSEKHIFDCLDSVFAHNDIGEDLEVIVVDNCSDNVDSMDYLLKDKYNSKIVFIRNKTNGGYGMGNNVGIRACHSPIVMIMNPDVRLYMPIFQKVISEFDRNSKCVMVGITQKMPDARGRSFLWSFRSPFWLGQLLYPFCYINNVYIQKYMCFHGSLFFIRKKTFEEVGLFDENIFMYGEEEDIHWRLQRKQSHKMVFLRDLGYIHLHIEKTNNYNAWLKKAIQSKIYLNRRDGFEGKQVILQYIKQTKVFLFREYVNVFLGKRDGNHISQLKERLCYLKEVYKGK